MKFDPSDLPNNPADFFGGPQPQKEEINPILKAILESIYGDSMTDFIESADEGLLQSLSLIMKQTQIANSRIDNLIRINELLLARMEFLERKIDS